MAALTTTTPPTATKKKSKSESRSESESGAATGAFLQRVTFESGSIITPPMHCVSEYTANMQKSFRRTAGACVKVTTTDTQVQPPSSSFRFCVDNVCGTIDAFFQTVQDAGDFLLPGAPPVGQVVKCKRFLGKHYQINSVHGRLSYIYTEDKWDFKGAWALCELVRFLRNVTQDHETPVVMNVNMVSARLLTGVRLLIDPAYSLIHRILTLNYSQIITAPVRTDDVTNLVFFNVRDWKALVTYGVGQCASPYKNLIVRYVEEHAPPVCNVGYTTKGIFKINVTFEGGCFCVPPGGSAAAGRELNARMAKNVERAERDKDTLDAFVQAVVDFITLLLLQLGQHAR